MNFAGNWVDLVILIFLLIFIVDGIRSGFLDETTNLIGFFFAFFGALNFYPLISKLITKYFTIQPSFSNAIAFFVIWFLIENIYVFILRPPWLKVPQEFIRSRFNRFLGFAPAILNGLVLSAIVLTLVVSLPFPPKIKADVFKSEIGSEVVRLSQKLEKPLDRALGRAVSDTLTFLTIRPQSRERVDLGFKQPEFGVDQTSEQRMLELVNQERVKVGLKILSSNSRLQAVARKHSEDMLKRGYFSHYSPEGKDVADRLQEEGVDFLAAGENLAFAPNVVIAHQGLMNSSGHRANILSSNFAAVGIGVIDGGAYGKMFTQVFTD